MSLYEGLSSEESLGLTKKLVNEHPVDMDTLAAAVLMTWKDLMETKIMGQCIIYDIGASAQTLGSLLHSILPSRVDKISHLSWRKEHFKADKDVVCEDDESFSFEVKTSSDKSKIFGNRSFAQEAGQNDDKTSRDGYYLAINFEKTKEAIRLGRKPQILKISFGYLEHSDWIAQKSSKGQAAHLSPTTYQTKFITLYEQNNSHLQHTLF